MTVCAVFSDRSCKCYPVL